MIALSLFSLEASAAESLLNNAVYTQDSSCNSFTKLLHKINVFSSDGTDPRTEQARDGDGKMFAPIGLIEPRNPVPSLDPNDVDAVTHERKLVKSHSTSFLISPCYVLTNYHSVFGGSKEPSDKFVASFFNFDPETKSNKMTRATPVAWGNYNQSTKRADDWALVKLDACVGKKIGWLETDVRNTGELYNKEVASAGYPIDKKVTSLWIHRGCRFIEYSPTNYENTFFNNCATRHASSGSPVFDLENGYPQVLALQASDRGGQEQILKSYSSDKANVAIDIRVILPKINQIISDDKMAFGSKNPSLPVKVLAEADKSNI